MKKNTDKKKGQAINSITGNNYIYVEDGQTFGTSTTTNTFIITDTKKLLDSKLIETKDGNLIEMIYEIIPNYGTVITHVGLNFESKKSLLKEIYGVKDGKLQLLKSIKGVENPGYYVPPSKEWEE